MTPGKPSDFARPWRVSPKSAMLCRSVHPGRMVMLPRADMQTCVYIYNYIYIYILYRHSNVLPIYEFDINDTLQYLEYMIIYIHI